MQIRMIDRVATGGRLTGDARALLGALGLVGLISATGSLGGCGGTPDRGSLSPTAATPLITPEQRYRVGRPTRMTLSELEVLFAGADRDQPITSGRWSPVIAGEAQYDFATPVTIPIAAEVAALDGSPLSAPSVTLRDVLRVLNAGSQAPFEIDRRRLSDLRISESLAIDTPSGTVSLAMVMDEVERSAARRVGETGGEEPLRWVVRDRGLLLTTGERAADLRREYRATRFARRYALPSIFASIVEVERAAITDRPSLAACRERLELARVARDQAEQRVTRRRSAANGREADVAAAAVARAQYEAATADLAAAEADDALLQAEIMVELDVLDELVLTWLADTERSSFVRSLAMAIGAEDVDASVTPFAYRLENARNRGIRARRYGRVVEVDATPGEHEVIETMLERLAEGRRLPRGIERLLGEASMDARSATTLRMPLASNEGAD